jgi:hypothetical protein
MSDPASLTSLFAAAEQAAMAGDFATAARVLGEVARAQEADLGPDHLELANTLNNLAVAHERSGQLDAAEREYRRAHAIAARRLPPDHPQVTTSAQNLREFCEANGRPLEAPRPEPTRTISKTSAAGPRVPSGKTPAVEPLAITFAGDAASNAPVARAATPTPTPRMPAMEPRLVAAPDPGTPRAARLDAPPRPAPIPVRRSWLPVLLAIGAVGVLLIWLLSRGAAVDPPATPQAATPEGSPAPPAGPPAAPPTPPPAAKTPPAAAPTTPSTARDATPPAPNPSASAAARTGADGVSVGEARLCATLAPGYRCTAAASPVRAGSLTFYTRIVAPGETFVVHRWYRGNELRQAVRLDVPPRRNGFRTFSRATVSAAEADWRVELRTRDGRLLHTETFTVR